MGRTTQINHSDGGWTQNAFTDSPPLAIQTTTSQAPFPNYVSNLVMDGFARKAQSQLLSDPQGTTYVDTSYDALGRVATVSNPHRSTAAFSDGITQSSYDALGRKTLQLQPDGSKLQWCYNGIGDPQHPQSNCRGNLSHYATGMWVDSADETGNDMQQASNAASRLQSVVEASSAVSDYSYNGAGNLLSVVQGGVAGESPRTRGFNYDSPSRLTRSTNPETSTTCYGQWSGSSCQGGYDANGNLLYKTDARGVTIAYSYDALNRLTSVSGLAGTMNHNLYYDGAGHGASIGRMMFASNMQNTAYALTYDAMGRVTQQQNCIHSDCS